MHNLHGACTNQTPEADDSSLSLFPKTLCFNIERFFLDRTHGDSLRRSLAASPSLHSSRVRLFRFDTRIRLLRPAPGIYYMRLHQIEARYTAVSINVQYYPVAYYVVLIIRAISNHMVTIAHTPHTRRREVPSVLGPVSSTALYLWLLRRSLAALLPPATGNPDACREPHGHATL